jgi:hypothetical protein
MKMGAWRLQTPHLSPLLLSEGERRKRHADYSALEWMLKLPR